MNCEPDHPDVRRVSLAVSEAVAAPAVTIRRGRPRRIDPAVAHLSSVTKITAAVILEVLAGERSTTSAAELIGVSPVRYYAIESRAIAGLIGACAPKPPGAAPGSGDADRVLRRAIAEKDGLTAQVRRLHALLRSAQRSLGVAPVEAKPEPAARADGKKPKRHRRARVRALTLVRRLMARQASTSTNPSVPGTDVTRPTGG